MECEQMIARLGLHDHPEGGHYKVTWRSEGTIPCGQVQPTSRYYLNEQWEGEAAKPEEVRHLSGAILFLLRGSQISRFHKLRSEEQWFFHATGSTPESKASLVIHTINEESGEYAAKRVGMNFDAGDEFQQFVTPGTSGPVTGLELPWSQAIRSGGFLWGVWLRRRSTFQTLSCTTALMRCLQSIRSTAILLHVSRR
eukprot:TRINITY_DN12265_c0_g1_i1.p1 TRINITY_DN12265_c0_g1~~TRINITY_DN12265_c0_g1_i1.p1  ORF type:complete len:197 (+),score=31.36 TRINITY_DN12265_c0_g1_i1:108-698(+)